MWAQCKNEAMAQYAAQRKQAGHSESGRAPFFVLRRGGRCRFKSCNRLLPVFANMLGLIPVANVSFADKRDAATSPQQSATQA
jgi:hypothetical protein